jgi:hypothetical protein
MNTSEQYTIDPIMYNGDIKSPPASSEGSSLNSETTIALSQSMDSVNTTPEDEVSENDNNVYNKIIMTYIQNKSTQKKGQRTV